MDSLVHASLHVWLLQLNTFGNARLQTVTSNPSVISSDNSVDGFVGGRRLRSTILYFLDFIALNLSHLLISKIYRLSFSN